MWFSASGRTILLVSEEVKFIQIFTGIIPSEGAKVKHPLGVLKPFFNKTVNRFVETSYLPVSE